MSNILKRMKKRIARQEKELQEELQEEEKQKSDEILVHGVMKYRCEQCGHKWLMFLEKGIEEFGEDHKPSPFVIRCKCGGMARDISGKIGFAGGGYYPLPDGASYFAHRKDSDCGVPILRD